jgi:hypothetical protein
MSRFWAKGYQDGREAFSVYGSEERQVLLGAYRYAFTYAHDGLSIEIKLGSNPATNSEEV